MKTNLPVPIFLSSFLLLIPANLVLGQTRESVPIIDSVPRPAIFPDTPSASPSNSRLTPSPLPIRTNVSYRVEVIGSDSELLRRVRSIEPSAFIRRRDGVIQAGVFRGQPNAQRRVQQLRNRGIQARIINHGTGQVVANSLPNNNPSFPNNNPSLQTLPFPDNNNGVVTQQPRNSSNNFPITDRGYFIVIPGSRENLPAIATQVVNLGVPRESIREKERPLGPHVAVGPFANGDLANSWQNYLLNAGLNARVHFQR